MPLARGIMIMDRASQAVLSVTITPNTVFCQTQSFTLTAHISAGGNIPPGSITFYLWTNNISFTNEGSGTIDAITGDAQVTVPASSLTAGTTYYIQAVYPGSGSYVAQQTPSGTAGIPIEPELHIATSTAVTVPPAFCAYTNEPFTVTVSPTAAAPAPTDGSVTLWAQGDGPYFQLATTGGTVGAGGIATITVTGGLSYQWFNAPGGNNVYAIYSGDGTCYAGSQSPTVIVTTQLNSVTMNQGPTMNGGSPFSFCTASGNSDSWAVGVSGSNGDITGTFTLFTDVSYPSSLASITTTVTGGIGIVNFGSIPESHFPTGNQYAYVVFSPTVTTNCYKGALSGDSSSFTVVNSSTQIPPVTLEVALASGGPYGTTINTQFNTNTIWCQVTVNKTGMISSDSSTISLYAGSLNGGPYPSNVTGDATYFPSGSPTFTDGGGNSTTITFSFSCSYFGNVNQTFYMIATYNGNGCFGSSNSGQVTINQSQFAQ